MYKYTLDFININNDDKYTQYKYFENFFIKCFSNLEYYFFNKFGLQFMIKPYLRVKNEYYELNNILQVNKECCLLACGKYEKLFFKFNINKIKNNFNIMFNIDNNTSSVFTVHFMLVINNNQGEDFSETEISKNKCFKYGNYYIYSPNCSAVNYDNIKFFGYKIKKLQDKSCYIDFTINLDKGCQVKNVYIFNDMQSLVEYFYIGEKNYYRLENHDKKPLLDIFTADKLFDNICDFLLNNLYDIFYKSLFVNDNFYFNFNFLILFDKSIVKFILNNDNNINQIARLQCLLHYYNIYSENFSGVVGDLVDELNNNIKLISLEDLYYLVDLLIEVDKLPLTYVFYNKLIKLKNSIVNIFKSINIDLLLKAVNNKITVDSVLVISKFALYFDKKIFDNLCDLLIEKEYFNVSFINEFIDEKNKGKYYESLYYLYCNKTRDLILNLIISNKDNYIEILAIILNKIIGFDIVNFAICINPRLPTKLNKVLFNCKIGNSLYTIIAKRSADIFTVNDVEYPKKLPVKIVDGFVKIVVSSS